MRFHANGRRTEAKWVLTGSWHLLPREQCGISRSRKLSVCGSGKQVPKTGAGTKLEGG